LLSTGINFIQQKKFPECKNINCLPFDLYLPTHNLCIEFDGRQHYESISFFGGDDGFIKRKKNDFIKNQFCKNNNIELIRISYEDINIIDNILSSLLLT
jgi:very-short-patch-repair endonuclease